MGSFNKDAKREVNLSLASEIEENAQPVEGELHPIYFREEMVQRKGRQVYQVSIELLRYRKDNGRILSDVLSHEKLHGELNEGSPEAQTLLEGFLEKKNPSENVNLKRLIDAEGQRLPAIITADGFLINGNRRKLALKKLNRKFMRVVILPPFKSEPAPPTLREIEEIENRYQFQKEGKADYSGIDKALSMRLKMEKGMSLEDQLLDDPQFNKLPRRKFQAEAKRMERELINPLNCVDRYLSSLGRESLYDTISETWTAFIDLSKFIEDLSQDAKYRTKLGIEQRQIGTIEEIGFQFIRRQTFKGIRLRINDIIRELKDLVANPTARQELMRLKNIKFDLNPDEKIGQDGKELSHVVADRLWGDKNESQLTAVFKKASALQQHEEEGEKPIDLLESAWDKLNHDRLKEPSGIALDRIEDAERLARNIKNRAIELEKIFLAYGKEKRKFARKTSQ